MSNNCRTLAWSSISRSPSHQVVALAIADFANEDGYCWPSHASIMAKAVSIKSKSRLRAIIKDLEHDGFLSREIRSRKDGSKSSNNYWINLPISMLKTNPEPKPTTDDAKLEALKASLAEKIKNMNSAMPRSEHVDTLPVDNLSVDKPTPVDNYCFAPISEYCTHHISAVNFPDLGTVLPGSEYCPPVSKSENQIENKDLQNNSDLESSVNQNLLTKESTSLNPLYPPLTLHQRFLATGLGEKEVHSFMTYRFKNRKHVDPVVLETIVEQMESLVSKGQNAKEVLTQTIANEWKGFFPVTSSTTGTPRNWKTPAAENYAVQAGDLYERMRSQLHRPLGGQEGTATPYEALYEADRRGMTQIPTIGLPEGYRIAPSHTASYGDLW